MLEWRICTVIGVGFETAREFTEKRHRGSKTFRLHSTGSSQTTPLPKYVAILHSKETPFIISIIDITITLHIYTVHHSGVPVKSPMRILSLYPIT